MSETTVDVVEVLEPSTRVYEVTIGDTLYFQKPLSFFGKIEFFSVLGDAVEKALASGTTVTELLEGDVLSGTGGDADSLIKGIAKIARIAPELLGDIFAISLGVPRSERVDFKESLELLTDEQGNAIINQFVDQNWEAMEDFFSAQSNLVKKVSEKMQSKSTSSKPSKATRTRTQKQ